MANEDNINTPLQGTTLAEFDARKNKHTALDTALESKQNQLAVTSDSKKEGLAKIQPNMVSNLLRTTGATLTNIPSSLAEMVPDTIGAIANLDTTQADRDMFDSIKAKEQWASITGTPLKLSPQEEAFKQGTFSHGREDRDAYSQASAPSAYARLNVADFSGQVSDKFDEYQKGVKDFFGVDSSAKDAAGEALAPLGEEFLKQAKAGEVVEAAKTLFDGAKETFGEHKQAAAETFIESIPYMTKYLFSKLLSVGMAPDIAEQSVRDFKKNNEGKNPTKEQVLFITGASSLVPMMERMGAALTGVSKIGTKQATKVSPNKLTESLKEVAKGYIGEGATEFGQGIAEEFAQTADVTKVKGGDAFVGAQLGSVSGGGAQVVQRTPSLVKAALDIIPEPKEKAVTAETGDVPIAQNLRTPKGETPVQKVQRKETLETQATEILTEVFALKEAGNTEKATQKLNEFKKVKAVIDDMVTETSVTAQEETKQVIQDLSSSDKSFAQEAANKLNEIIKFNPVQISQQQAEHLLETSPELLEEATKHILQVHSSIGKGLSEGKSTSQVGSDIVDGDVETGFIGLSQYRNAIYQRVLKGQEAKALFGALDSWVEQRKHKEAAFQKAVDLGITEKGFTPTNQEQQQALDTIKALGNEFVVPKLLADVKAENALIFSTQEKLKSLKQTPVTSSEQAPVVNTEQTVEQVPSVTLTPSKYERKSTVSDRVTAHDAVTLDMGYNELDQVQIYEEKGKYRVHNPLTENSLPKAFDSQEAAVAYLTEPSNLEAVDYALNREAHNERSNTKLKALTDAVKQSVRGVSAATQIMQLVNKATTPQELNTQIEEIKAKGLVEQAKYEELVALASSLTTTPQKKVTTRTKKVTAKAGSRLEQIQQIPNLIKAWFNEKETPFTKVPNTISTLAENISLAQAQLPDSFFVHSTLEGKETGAWGDAQTASVKLLAQVKENLYKHKVTLEKGLGGDSTAFAHVNLASELLQEDGTLPDSVFDAVIVTTYNWIASEAAGNIFNDEKSLKRMLQLDETAEVPSDIAQLLRKGGTTHGQLIDTLGKDLTKQLGLKGKRTESRANQTKLEQALGQVAITLLKESGTVEFAKIKQSTVDSWFSQGILDENTSGLKGGELNLVRTVHHISPQGEVVLKPAVEVIRNTERVSGKVISAIFGSSFERNAPRFEPRKEAPKGMKGTAQKLTKNLQGIIAKHQNRKHFIKEAVHARMQTMTRIQRAKMYGYVSVEDIAKAPAYQREGLEANNLAILRSIDHYDDFVSEMEVRNNGFHTAFYFDHEVWRNLRMGMKSNTVNIQTDKAHRHLISTEADIAEIKMNDSNAIKNFNLAVALGLGVDTDKLTEADSLNALAEALNTPEIQEALASIKQLRTKEDLTAHQQEQLNDKILAALKEKGHGYEVLVEYELYLDAIEKGDKTFTTSIISEVDGITNGAALSAFLTGVTTGTIQFSKDRLRRAGFFFNGETSFGELKKNSEFRDMYQQLTEDTVEYMKGIHTKELINSLEFFMGKFLEKGNVTKEGRDFSKEPLTGNVYGQGKRSVIRHIGYKGSTNFQDKLHKLILAEDTKGIEAFFIQTNELATYYASRFPEKMRNQKFNEFYQMMLEIKNNQTEFVESGLSTSTQTALEEVFGNTYGTGLATTIEDSYAAQKQSSATISASTQAMYALYQDKLDKAIEQKKEELTEAGSFDRKYDDLTVEQYEAVVDSVKEYLPTIPTLFSKREGTGKDTELKVGKSSRRRMQDDHAYKVETKFEKLGAIYGYAQVDANPSVSAVAQSIHQLDATIMYLALDKLGVTNIFDAVLGGVVTIDAATLALNEATHTVLKEMSPVTDITGNFNTVFTGMGKEVFTETLSQETQQEIGNALIRNIPLEELPAEIFTGDAFGQLLEQAIAKADKLREGQKKQIITEVGSLSAAERASYLGESPLRYALKEVIAQEYPYEVFEVFSKVSNKLAESVDEGKEALLKDLTYITQYNKENEGLHLSNNKVEKDIANEKAAQQKLLATMKLVKKNINKPIEFTPEPIVFAEGVTNINTGSFLASPIELEQVRSALESNNFTEATSIIMEFPIEVKQDLIEKLTITQDGSPIPFFSASVREEVGMFSNDQIESILVKGDIVGKKAIEKAFKGMDGLLDIVIDNMIPEGVSIVLGTPEVINAQSGENQQKLRTSNGIYLPDTHTIIIPSKHVVAVQGDRVKTLQHELTHAAQVHVIKELRETTSPEGMQLRDRLKLLRVKLIEADTGKFDYILKSNNSIEEMLAHGLENTEFIEFMKSVKYPQRKTAYSKFKQMLRQYFGLEANKYETAFDELLEVTEEINNLGSSQEGAVNVFTQQSSIHQSHKIVDKMNSKTIFEQIGNMYHRPLRKGHKEYLEGILGDMVNTILEPMKLVYLKNNKENLGLTVNDRIMLSMHDPKATAPDNSLSGAGFNMAPQELYVNQLLNATLDAGIHEASPERTALQRIYQYVKNTMKPEDLLNGFITEQDAGYADELALAQKKWDSVFGAQSQDGKTSNYLRNFAALAVTNEQFKQAIEQLPQPKKQFRQLFTGGIFNTIANLVTALIYKVASFATDVDVTGNQAVAIDHLARRITKIEDAHKNSLIDYMNAPLEMVTTGIDKASSVINTFVKGSLSKANKRLAKSNIRSGTLQLAEGLLDGRAHYVGEVLIAALGMVQKGKLGFVGQLMNELRTEVNEKVKGRFNPQANSRFHDMLMTFKHFVDKTGQDIATNVTSELQKAFAKPLQEEQRIALTKVIMKGDVSSLVQQGYSLPRIKELLDSPVELKKEITSKIAELKTASVPAHFNYYNRAAEAMGIVMATGKKTEVLTLQNAQRIADMDGLNTTGVNAASVVDIIDVLGSLHALNNVPVNYKTQVSNLMESELKRGSDNGIRFTLSLLHITKEQAIKAQFKDNPKDMVKGYVPMITNPNKEIAMSIDKKDKALLENGYELVGSVPRDRDDPTTGDRYIYLHPNGGKASYIQGILYINEQNARGTTTRSNRIIQGSGMPSYEAAVDVQDMITTKQKAIHAMLYPKQGKGVQRTYMTPTFKLNGDIKDFRYIAADDFTDNYLDRNNDLFHVLPKMAASNHTVPSSKEKNLELLDALKLQYEEDKANNNLKRYIQLSPQAGDKQLRETYHLIPEEVRTQAKILFGSDTIPVRNDLFDVIFGKRKWTVRDMWSQDAKENHKVQALIAKGIDLLTFKHGQAFAGQTEKGIHELATWVKDIVINKSLVIFGGNVASNTNFLVARGLSATEAVRQQAKAFHLAKKYVVAEQEIASLELRLETGMYPQNHKGYKTRIIELQDEINRSPIKRLIDKGMLPTISEGEITQEDTYTSVYKSKLNQWVDKGKSLVGERGSAVVDEVMINQNTETYKELSKATQLSDFAARYALIEHLTQKESMSFEDAVVDARRSFVNYDLPTHKALQYMGDMGFAWFLRYPVRMQRNIIASMANNPARVTALLIANSLTGNIVPNIYGSLYGIANPLDSFGFLDRLSSGAGLHPITTPF